MEFSMARRRKRQLSVLLIDVDDFKAINDQWVTLRATKSCDAWE